MAAAGEPEIFQAPSSCRAADARSDCRGDWAALARSRGRRFEATPATIAGPGLSERTAGGIARISEEGEVSTMTLGIQSVELHEGQ